MLPLHNIKNIILDLGGVIINIDQSLTIEEFKKLGCSAFHELYSQLNQVKLFDQYEMGMIDIETFRNELKKILPVNLTDDQIDEAWNKLLLDFPDERIMLLQQLKKRFRLFLLSNTNELHYKKYTRDFRNKFCFEFNSLFEKTYYSFKDHLRKPDEAYFKKVLDDNRLNPQETLFIDDTEMHINAAKNLNIQTYHLSGGKTINDILW